jgi:Leucine-rich repeat (LRR) protein
MISLNLVVSFKLNCEIKMSSEYKNLFYQAIDIFKQSKLFCTVSADDGYQNPTMERSTLNTTFVYTTTSDPILPKNLYEKYPSLKTCFFYYMGTFKIGPDWFQNSATLENLIFYQNKIQKLESGKFGNLKSLNTLYMRKNSIREIEGNAFIGLTNLTTLDLKLEFLIWNFCTQTHSLA